MKMYHRGSYRIGFLVGPLAIKLVKPAFIFEFFFGWVRFLGQKNFLAHTRASRSYSAICIMRGVTANLTEWYSYTVTGHAPHLAPTYFTLGLLNIQRRIQGELVPDKVLTDLLKSGLTEKEYLEWEKIDPHAVYNDGWRKTESGYVVFDYGNTFDKGTVSLSEVLYRQDEKLRRIFGKEIPCDKVPT